MKKHFVIAAGLLFSLSACSRPNYNSDTRQAFMKSCLSRCVGEAQRAMGAQATSAQVEKVQALCGELCECSYAEVARNIPYADFVYIEEAEVSGKLDERSQQIKSDLEKQANGCLKKMGIGK